MKFQSYFGSSVLFMNIAKISKWNILYRKNILLDMGFTDRQFFDAIESNVDVKDCFYKIKDACKELKTNTGCPDDDVDRFLEFTIGKWQWIDLKVLFIYFKQYLPYIQI